MKERFVTQFLQSITSPRFYQEIGSRRVSDGVRYFSFLILLVTALLSVRFTSDIFKGLASFETWSKEHLPEIVIEKGKVFVDVPQPWQREEGGFVIVIDTTGKTHELDEKYPQGVLLSQNRILLKRSPYESRHYDLSKIDSFRLNPTTIQSWRKVSQWVIPPLLSLFLFVYFWVGKFSQIVFFSGVSLLTNWVSKRGLPYGTLLTIGMYAITPPLLLFCVVALLGAQVRFFDMIYLSSYAALLVTAVLQCHPRTDEMVENS